jgi:tetratricopeptide (TPR) repeat protein
MVKIITTRKSSGKRKTKAHRDQKVEQKLAAHELNENGVLSFNTGNFYAANWFFDESLKLNPQNPVVLCNKANVLFRYKKYDEAMQLYNQALSIDPHNSHILKYKKEATQYIKSIKEEFKPTILVMGIIALIGLVFFVYLFSQDETECAEPYLSYGDECCIYKEGNYLCDKDETEIYKEPAKIADVSKKSPVQTDGKKTANIETIKAPKNTTTVRKYVTAVITSGTNEKIVLEKPKELNRIYIAYGIRNILLFIGGAEESRACLLGKPYKDGYLIYDYYLPHSLSKSSTSIVARECSGNNVVGHVHSHTNGVCELSSVDTNTFLKESFPIMGVQCGYAEYRFWAKDGGIRHLSTNVLEFCGQYGIYDYCFQYDVKEVL